MLATFCAASFSFRKALLRVAAEVEHYGIFIKPAALENTSSTSEIVSNEKGMEPRIEISGHLHNPEALKDGSIRNTKSVSIRFTWIPTIRRTIVRIFFTFRPTTSRRLRRNVARVDSFGPWHSVFASYLRSPDCTGARARRRSRFHLHVVARQQEGLSTQSEHLANRVEVSGLFWHFVDLVWIFVFRFSICSEHEQSARYCPRPREHEEYAHGVHQHVSRYLIVGAILLFFTLLTVALSYVDFGGFFSWLFHVHIFAKNRRKVEHCGRLLSPLSKSA